MTVMKHVDGYCDACGCVLVDVVQLTFDGLTVCDECVKREIYYAHRVKVVERDNDGR